MLEINYHPNTPTPKPTADSPASHKKPQQYIEYRKAGISLINNFFDRTIAVSEQTKRILLSLGADEKNIKTSYIGTKHMERMNSMKRKLPSCRDLHICYMGYMRKDKGFFFFLNTLNQLPPDTASQINVTIAAKFTDIEATKMMESLAKKFRTFRAFDGYTHDQLQHILAPVNLGIIPALWEDNLPQVAIEFVTHGIPILTSHLGGAKEISNNPFYVFDIAKPSSLCEKLCNFVESDSPIPDFWNGTLHLRSNEQHVEEILRIYDEVIARRRA